MTERKYIFLDGVQERQGLVNEIEAVRDQVIAVIRTVPEKRCHEPRYYGLSPARLLGHLYLMDLGGMLAIRAAQRGLHLPISARRLEQIDKLAGRLFQRRLIEDWITQLEQLRTAIEDLILELPMDHFTKEVYHPALDKRLLIEQALQAFFLHHWQDHLVIIQGVEAGVFYEPPGAGEPPISF